MIMKIRVQSASVERRGENLRVILADEEGNTIEAVLTPEAQHDLELEKLGQQEIIKEQGRKVSDISLFLRE